MQQGMISGRTITQLYAYVRRIGISYNDLRNCFQNSGIVPHQDVAHYSTRQRDMFLDEYIQPLRLDESIDAERLARFIEQVVGLYCGPDEVDPDAQTLLTSLRLDGWQVVGERLFVSPSVDGMDVQAQPSSRPPTDVVPILFLAADPSDASRLRLGEELREIQEKLQLAKLRDRFQLHQRMSVRPTDISQALLDVQPQIVHFSGHGTVSGALCFENTLGGNVPIEPRALAALFEQFAGQVRCVLLNACYSEIQAYAIAEHIDHVIGMNQAVGDRAAIAFAIGFYQALGAGRTVEEAYRLGCVQIRLQGIPEHLTPVLLNKR